MSRNILVNDKDWYIATDKETLFYKNKKYGFFGSIIRDEIEYALTEYILIVTRKYTGKKIYLSTHLDYIKYYIFAFMQTDDEWKRRKQKLK